MHQFFLLRIITVNMKSIQTILIAYLLGCMQVFAQSGSQVDSCNQTWLKLLGEPGSYELGITLCPSKDGNLYATGTTQDSAVLLKIDPAGKIIWTRYFDFFPGYDRITYLSIDSEGMLLGCGNSNTSFNGIKNSFFFKYNPLNDAFIWIFQPEFFTINAGIVGGIKEKHAGGNYYASFQAAVGSGAVIMEINRQTGKEIPGSTWRYDWGNSNFSPSFILHGPYLILTGFSATASGTRRQSLVCIDTSDGQAKWSQLNHIPLGKSANLSGESGIIDGNALITVYSGNDQANTVSPSFIFLQKTTLDGERKWLKKYDLLAFTEERATEIIRVSDGYVIFGQSRAFSSTPSGLFFMKTDFDGTVLWARFYHYSNNDYVFTAIRDREFIEMDGFFYFTAFSEDAAGGTDLLLAKLNAEGLVNDSCAYIIDTPVGTFTIADAVSETPTLTFTNIDNEVAAPLPIAETASSNTLTFKTICEQVCNNEESCDIKTNTCVTFELLRIVVDAAGNRRYRVRFTNNCADQNLNYLAVQVPKGTYAVGPADGETYIAESGRAYTVRNPNSSPFFSIRFKAQGQGLAQGESDVFEYTIIGQAQPVYINVFARLTPGPSYEAHLNVFNCPVEYETQNRNAGTFPATASVFPNPATNQLWVTIPEVGNGEWQIFSADGKQQKAGNWQAANRLSIPVSDLAPGIYFLQLAIPGYATETIRFVKME